jgi:hypothetical protein
MFEDLIPSYQRQVVLEPEREKYPPPSKGMFEDLTPGYLRPSILPPTEEIPPPTPKGMFEDLIPSYLPPSILTPLQLQKIEEERHRLEEAQLLERQRLEQELELRKELGRQDYMAKLREHYWLPETEVITLQGRIPTAEDFRRFTTPWGEVVVKPREEKPLKFDQDFRDELKIAALSIQKERAVDKDPLPNFMATLKTKYADDIDKLRALGAFEKAFELKKEERPATWGQVLFPKAAPAQFMRGVAGVGRLLEERISGIVGKEIDFWKTLIKTRDFEKTMEKVGQKDYVPKDTFFEQMANYWTDIAEKYTPPTEPGTAKSYVQAALQSTAINAPFYVVAALTKNPAVALGAMGTQVAGDRYQTMREKGFSVEESTETAFKYGAAEAIPELIPMGILLKQTGKGLMPIVKKLVSFVGTEVPQEEVTEILQAMIDKKTINPDMTMAELGQRLRDVAIITPMSAGLLGAGTIATQEGLRRIVEKKPIIPPTKPIISIKPEVLVPEEITLPEKVIPVEKAIPPEEVALPEEVAPPEEIALPKEAALPEEAAPPIERRAIPRGMQLPLGSKAENLFRRMRLTDGEGIIAIATDLAQQEGKWMIEEDHILEAKRKLDLIKEEIVPPIEKITPPIEEKAPPVEKITPPIEEEVSVARLLRPLPNTVAFYSNQIRKEGIAKGDLTEEDYAKIPPYLKKEEGRTLDEWATKFEIPKDKLIKTIEDEGKIREEIETEFRRIKGPYAQQIRLRKEAIKERARYTEEGLPLKEKIDREQIISQLRQKQDKIVDVKRQVIDYIKASLPPFVRGKFLNTVRTTKTQKDLIKAFTKIDEETKKVETKDLTNELRNTLKRLSESKSIAIDYKQRIQNLVEPIEIKGHKERTIERLTTIDKYIKRQETEGKDVSMPKRVLESLKILKRKPISEMTNPQIQSLIDQIKALEQLGKTKLRTIRELYKIERDKKFEEVITNITPVEKQPIFRAPVGKKISFFQSFHNKFNGFLNTAQHLDLSLTAMDVWFDILDGSPGTYDGVVYKTFKATTDNAWGKYLDLKDQFIDPLWKLHDGYKLTQESRDRLGVYAILVQEGGMERLIKTGYTEEEVKSIVLTPKERRIYAHWTKWTNEIKPQITNLARMLYNIELKEVKNYFPFAMDFKAMSEVEIWKRFGDGVEEIGMPTKNVEVGFLKERVAPGKVKIDFMEVATRHIDNVSYFLTMAHDIKVLSEIANSSKFGKAAGELGQRITQEWMDLMARKGGSVGDRQIQILDTLRKNVGAAVLGFKLSSTLVQPTSLLDGASLIGGRWVFNGMTDFVSDTRWRDLIRKLPEIKKRKGDDPAFLQLSNNKSIAKWQAYGYAPLKYIDTITAGGVATGAYQKYLHKHKIPIDFSKLHPEAAEYAQKWMRLTQSSSFFKDVPLAISKGKMTGNRSFDRAVFQFQNFLLKRWNTIRHDSWRAGIKEGRVKKFLHIHFWLMMALMAEMGVRRASGILIDFITKRPQREEDGITEQAVKTLLGNVPLISNALSVSVYGGEPMPVLEAIKKPVKAVPQISVKKELGLINLGEASLTFMGIPGASQFGQIGRGLVAAEKEKKAGW